MNMNMKVYIGSFSFKSLATVSNYLGFFFFFFFCDIYIPGAESAEEFLKPTRKGNDLLRDPAETAGLVC